MAASKECHYANFVRKIHVVLNGFSGELNADYSVCCKQVVFSFPSTYWFSKAPKQISLPGSHTDFIHTYFCCPFCRVRTRGSWLLLLWAPVYVAGSKTSVLFCINWQNSYLKFEVIFVNLFTVKLETFYSLTQILIINRFLLYQLKYKSSWLIKTKLNHLQIIFLQ